MPLPSADPIALKLLQLEDRLVPAGQITGRAFLDFNSDGLFDPSATHSNDGSGTYVGRADVGVAGVSVTVFDSTNIAQGSTTTGADGTYTLSATGTGGYRLEFSNAPAGVNFGPQGAGSATAVQFVPDGNSNNRNVSLTTTQGTADNPLIITNEYRVGDQTGTLPRGSRLGSDDYSQSTAIISFPYSAGTTSQSDAGAVAQPDTHALAVQARYVGTTWGLAENTRTDTILAAAYTKKHAGYGPNGPGAIYTFGTTGTTATLWIDLGAATVGGNFRAGYTTNDDYFSDSGNTGWDAVGKTSFGGLAINDAGTEVYVMNLADRRLYTIQVNADGSAGAVTSILIPLPGNATGDLANGNRGDVRPFAVEYRDGLVYVGLVNSAESTQNRDDLRGYVYTYNPVTGQWSNRSVINESATVDGFALNYSRGTSFAGSDDFRAWSPTFRNVNGDFDPATNNGVKYPQPILSAIAFGNSGNLILGIRDRGGDQLGNQVPSDPSLPNQLDLGVSAGDILKTTNNGNGTFTLENNASAGGATTGGANTNQGPGGGEFYYQDNYQVGTHNEVQSGAVAHVDGFPDVITTVFDPLRLGVTKTAGIRWYDNATGTVSKAYQIYDNSAAGTFGKATGLGDLLVVEPPTGLEIGNRVWNDANANGRQDAGESGISGVQVILSLNGAAFATATTDANGEYYFSSNAGATTTNKVFGLNLAQAGNYSLVIPVSQGPIAGLTLTSTDINGNSEDQRDSDFAANGVLALPALVAGTSNHTFDAGFRPPANGVLSGFVYADRNNNGQFETGSGEPAIGGVTVVLTGTDAVGNAIASRTATTDATGFYQFTGLLPGTYAVAETQPVAFLDGLDTPGSLGGSNTVNDVLSGIVLPANGSSINNNFGELEPAALNGYVYLDSNNDGVFQISETPIAGVTVVLSGSNDLGAIAPQTLTTNAAGFYSFTNLRPGTYRIIETQPAGFSDGRDTPGTPGGGTSLVNDVIDTITLTSGLVSPNNNFGERPIVGSLSGYVYRDPNVNGRREPGLGELGIAGVQVVLFAEGPNGPTAVATAFTASNGFYRFANIAPGNYRVAETQPLGFFDGLDTPGSTGGSNGINDILTVIPVPAGGESSDNNFGEVQTVNLYGNVWIDNNRNGIFDPGEAGIPNAVVTIGGTAFAGTPIANALNASQVPSGLSIFTDANGRYDFFRLPPGSYSLVQTNTPAGLIDFASQNAAPGLPILLSTNTTFGGIGLQLPAPGPLNFGKVSPNTIDPGDPSKGSFLGSTLLGAIAPTGNPHVGAPTTIVNTTPLFSVANTTSAESVYVAAGAGAGFAPVVRVFNYKTGAEAFRFLAFDSSFLGGVQTATGDINGDGTPDIIAAAGAGAGPHVKVFDGLTGAEIRSFFAYDPTFRGGVLVASGDVDGDGFDDIITGAMSSAAPHVKVFSGRTGQEIQSFFAFDQSITTGVRVASADINGDGRADIVASTGEGVPARVRAFDGTTLALLSDLSVFDGYAGGVYVSAGDFDGDGRADIAVSSGVGASRVAVYNAGGGELASFFADTSNTSGVRVAMKDLNGDGIADVITGAGIGTASRITGFSGAGLGIIEDFYLFDSGVRTGVFVG